MFTGTMAPSNGGVGLFFKGLKKHPFVVLMLSAILVFSGMLLLWVSTLKIPDLDSFEQRKISQSTKIYDRTGEVLLYDIVDGTKRTIVPFGEISRNIKNATVAIEDSEFYDHGGVRPLSFIRAAVRNLVTGSYSQGGSTITQQVVKNSLLTKEKKISRKLKEWFLSIKIEQMLSKEEILGIYLNETSYGGNIYGVEEAGQQFFGKNAKDLTIPESAYLAAIPQATTYYSPYGQNRGALEERKNLVLIKMKDKGFINDDEYNSAIKEVVSFKPQEQYGIKAPHFVLFVKDILERRFGGDVVRNGGLKVITTLDYALQEKAEELAKKTALKNEKTFNAKNIAIVALDPKTGDVLTMVGSRDYFDKEIEGNYNVITGGAGGRQPGSSFKPIVYAQAFSAGYTPETVLFDLKTEFSSLCDSTGVPLNPKDDPKGVCYSPVNYDDVFRGPITLRDALAQSINVPSVKVLYLVGINNVLNLAKSMGITTLADKNRYGLTLVLGGGEVTPLELTSAYGTFANNGVHMNYQTIERVEDGSGKILFSKSLKGFPVLKEGVAQTISSILSDNTARTPSYGQNSVLFFPGYDVAVKTGTTNDYKDAWTVGYTPFIVIGAWAGNNDNKPMEKKVAGQIIAPMWSEFMGFALSRYPKEDFKKPEAENRDLKPVFRGIWKGGESYEIDTVSGKLSTEYTPEETKKEVIVLGVHSILFWVDKNDPFGQKPADPGKDSQFYRWEKPVREWALRNGFTDGLSYKPTEYDDIHTEENKPLLRVGGVNNGDVFEADTDVYLSFSSDGRFGLSRVVLYINGSYIKTLEGDLNTVINFSNINSVGKENELLVVGYDSVFNKNETVLTFSVLDR